MLNFPLMGSAKTEVLERTTQQSSARAHRLGCPTALVSKNYSGGGGDGDGGRMAMATLAPVYSADWRQCD